MTIECKTKIIETVADPNLVRIVTKDSLTANDAAIQADLPVAEDKTAQTCSVFHLLKKNNIPVAYITRNNSTSFIAKKCEMLPIECVMRRRAFGSYLKREPSKTSGEIFDPLLTEFFHKHAIVFHPETSYSDEHVEMMSEDEARELYLKDGEWTSIVYTDPLIDPHEQEWLLYPAKQPRNQIRKQSLLKISPVIDLKTLDHIKNNLMIPCFEIIEKEWKKFDVDLIDMKIEVGYSTYNKELVIADVIDNDSWRIWPNGDPKQQLDKQSFRYGEALTEVQKKYRIVTEYTKNF